MIEKLFLAVVNPEIPRAIPFVYRGSEDPDRKAFAHAWEQAIERAPALKAPNDWGLDEIVIAMAELGYDALPVRSVVNVLGEIRPGEYGAWMSKIKDGAVYRVRPETGEEEVAFQITKLKQS